MILSGLGDEELTYSDKHRRVRALLKEGIDKICNECLLEGKNYCNDLWFKVTVDTTDTHRFFHSEMIFEAIRLWETRIELFDVEIKRRKLIKS